KGMKSLKYFSLEVSAGLSADNRFTTPRKNNNIGAKSCNIRPSFLNSNEKIPSKSTLQNSKKRNTKVADKARTVEYPKYFRVYSNPISTASMPLNNGAVMRTNSTTAYPMITDKISTLAPSALKPT